VWYTRPAQNNLFEFYILNPPAKNNKRQECAAQTKILWDNDYVSLA